MFKNTFNLNGVDYKVVDGLVHTLSKGTLEPCYKTRGHSALSEFCRTHDLKLYDRPSGLHAYGNQTGQRGETLEQIVEKNAHQQGYIPGFTGPKTLKHVECAQGIPVERAQDPATAKLDELFWWNTAFIIATIIIAGVGLVLLYELFFVPFSTIPSSTIIPGY